MLGETKQSFVQVQSLLCRNGITHHFHSLLTGSALSEPVDGLGAQRHGQAVGSRFLLRGAEHWGANVGALGEVGLAGDRCGREPTALLAGSREFVLSFIGYEL
jgi:hypothetical protein